MMMPHDHRPQEQERPAEDLADHLEMATERLGRLAEHFALRPRLAHLLDVGHDLREGEDADQNGQERKAAADELGAEREARHACRSDRCRSP